MPVPIAQSITNHDISSRFLGTSTIVASPASDSAGSAGIVLCPDYKHDSICLLLIGRRQIGVSGTTPS